MADRRPAIIEIDRPIDHAATDAWRRLAEQGPVAVHVLKETWKTLAYRLTGCGPEGGDVVATRRLTSTTLVERQVYSEILPRADVPTLRLLGVIDEDDGTSWMFLDDAGEQQTDLRDFRGRERAGEWLGRLHAGLRDLAAPDGLPDRGAADALRLLRSSRADIVTAATGPAVDVDGRRFLGDLVRLLDRIESGWGAVEEAVDGLPSTLVHADFVGKNIRDHVDRDGRPSVVVFDWEMSGWGVPLRDLAAVDVGAYVAAAGAFWGPRVAEVGRLADIGRMFSLLASVEWEMLGLLTDWPQRYLDRLRVFHDRLGTVATRTGVMPTRSWPSAGTSPDPQYEDGGSDGMGDADRLARGLRSMEPFGSIRIVEVVDQVPNVYSSTFPSAIVRCVFDDGVTRPVFVKRHVPGLHAGGRFWDGGAYEADVYRDLLSASRFGTPDYYGSWSDPEHEDSFLAIAYLDGWRLSRSEPGWLIEAARKLGGLHRDITPIALRHPAIRRYDRSFYTARSTEALMALRNTKVGAAWREPLFRAFDEEMVPNLLLTAEPSFIHGEPYPQNIIVSEGQVVVVDWQSAAIGPGAIDLACLTLGHWPAELVTEGEAVYIAERWGTGSAPPTFGAELVAARIYWSMRWLGAEADATTAAQRESDVEALRQSAARLGLVSLSG